MRYKDQGDIDYRAFDEFTKRIEGLSNDEVKRDVVRTFYPSSKYSDALVLDFYKALKTESKSFPYVLDLNFPLADRFIDAEMFLQYDDKLSLAKWLIKPKYKWQKIKWSLAIVNMAYNAFLDFATPIKERYEWIYSPPILPSSNNVKPNVLAIEFQKDFVQHYGAYMEIIYLLSNGDMTRLDEITEMPLHKFLFLGEYMLRKRRIESIN